MKTCNIWRCFLHLSWWSNCRNKIVEHLDSAKKIWIPGDPDHQCALISGMFKIQPFFFGKVSY